MYFLTVVPEHTQSSNSYRALLSWPRLKLALTKLDPCLATTLMLDRVAMVKEN